MKGEISIRQELKKYAPLLVFPIIFSIALYVFVHGFTMRQLKARVDQTVDLFYIQMSSMTRETETTAQSLTSDFAMLANLEDTASLTFSYSDPFSICRQIEIRKSGSPYIDHIYFISSQNNAIYSDCGYYTYSSLSTILSGIGLREDEFLSIDESHWDMSTTGLLKEPFFVMPFRTHDGDISGRLLFTISLDKFVETISSLDAELACLYTEDFLISSRSIDGGITIASLSSEGSVSTLLGKSVKCFYGQTGDYTYLIALDAGEYYAPLIWMVVGFLVYAMLVLIIDYLYLLRVSKARYTEFTTLINALPQESGERSPSYHELVLAVQTALLNAADLREKQQLLARDRVIHDIFHKRYNQSLQQRYMQEIGIPISATTYYLARFSIRKWDSIALTASSPEDSHQMAWTIFEASAKQLTDAGIEIFCDNDTDAFNALFCGDFREQSTYVEATCEKICKFIHDEYGILLHASVSNPTQTVLDIPNLLLQVQKLESFSMSINSASLVISENLLKGQGGSLTAGNFFRQEMTLFNTLLARKYDIVPAMVAAILEEYVTNNPDYDLAMSRMKAVSGTLAEALLAIKDVDLDLAFYAKRLREVDSISAFNADVEFVFLELDSVINAAADTFKEVDEACSYIQKNLDDKNLNVTLISEAVGTIPQRLIPMFQKQLNMGIAEYVNYQRIEKATKLLTTTKLKVNQISDMVGYCNTDTFTRNFRKLMGVTPTEYRQASQ